jgi:hypothetical protein
MKIRYLYYFLGGIFMAFTRLKANNYLVCLKDGRIFEIENAKSVEEATYVGNKYALERGFTPVECVTRIPSSIGVLDAKTYIEEKESDVSREID